MYIWELPISQCFISVFKCNRFPFETFENYFFFGNVSGKKFSERDIIGSNNFFFFLNSKDLFHKFIFIHILTGFRKSFNWYVELNYISSKASIKFSILYVKNISDLIEKIKCSFYFKYLKKKKSYLTWWIPNMSWKPVVSNIFVALIFPDNNVKIRVFNVFNFKPN